MSLLDATNWINVKKQLPDHDFKVLAINQGLTDLARYQNGKWFSLSWNREMGDSAITYWMELPEIPEDKEWKGDDIDECLGAAKDSRGKF